MPQLFDEFGTGRACEGGPGVRPSAGVFGSVADLLVAIYLAFGYGPIKKWVDDFFAIRLPGMSWTEDDFIELTARLGVPWSLTKLRRFASTQRYIGFDWDLDAKAVIFPADKLAATSELVRSWQVPRAVFTASEAASLHGKLVHASSIFPLIRPFLRSAASFALSFLSPRAHRHPPSALVKDLAWVSELLTSLPPSMPLQAYTPRDIGWWGDASTSFGVGVVVGEWWAAWSWAEGFRVGPGREFDIGWAEAVAVELGLHMALMCRAELGLSSAQCLLVRSDNEGVVNVVNKGRSRSRNTNAVLKEIYALLASNALSLRAEHVPGSSNVSDALSRGDVDGFLAAFPAARHKLDVPLPLHLRPRLRSV